MGKAILKYGYPFVILFLFVILTQGMIARSLYVLHAISGIPVFLYIIGIAGVILYFAIAACFIVNNRKRLWGIMLCAEAAICSISIIIAVQYIEKQEIHSFYMETAMPASELVKRENEIARSKGIKTFISFAKNGIEVRFKRSPNETEGKELSIYIKSRLSNQP
jgi:hypothetical protein